MKVEYAIVAAFVGGLYLVIKQLLPDFPVSDVVFQTVILYCLAKIGVDVVNGPANAIRNFFAKG
jgi:hypothetical protein